MSFLKNFNVIIPLRAGSKGLSNKNIATLDRKPLYLHAVDLALKANASRIIVSTNIQKVLETKLNKRVEVVNRSENLCNDNTLMAPVVIDTIKKLSLRGTVVLLQPTSPLRSLDDLRASLSLFVRSGSDLVLTVTAADSSVLKWGKVNNDGFFQPLSSLKNVFSNRQSLPPVYKPNGAIYVFNAEWFLKNKNFDNAKTISAIKMPENRSYDIDTLEDLTLCEKILTSKRNNK